MTRVLRAAARGTPGRAAAGPVCGGVAARVRVPAGRPGRAGTGARTRAPTAGVFRALLAACLVTIGSVAAPGAAHAASAVAGAASPPAGSGPTAQDTAAPASSTTGSTKDVEISDRAYAIARKLRCPVCTAESVADSNAEISAEMRVLIQQQLDAGKSEAQIIRYFKQRYGDWILLDPPKRGVHLLVWLLPVLALLGGLVALAMLVRRWRAAAEDTPPADPEALARVRRALASNTGTAEGGEDDGRRA